MCILTLTINLTALILGRNLLNEFVIELDGPAKKVRITSSNPLTNSRKYPWLRENFTCAHPSHNIFCDLVNYKIRRYLPETDTDIEKELGIEEHRKIINESKKCWYELRTLTWPLFLTVLTASYIVATLWICL